MTKVSYPFLLIFVKPRIFFLAIFCSGLLGNYSAVFAIEIESASFTRADTIHSFSLINAKSGKIISSQSPISNGAEIDLSKLPTKITIRANMIRDKRVKSVKFYLNGQPASRARSSRPFVLAGRKDKRLRSWTPSPGDYTLTAVPFSRRKGKGAQGLEKTISIRVVNSSTPKVSAPRSPAPPISRLAEWESNMIKFGEMHCDLEEILDLTTWEGSVWYYDGMRAYYQIADYTGNTFWNLCSDYVREVYRDFVLNSDGLIQGWRVFPHGLAEDYYRNGDSDSRDAVVLMAQNSAWANQGGGESFELSRETAYLIHAYLTAMEIGEVKHPNLDLSVNYAIGHIEQWAVSKTATYVKPWMIGLTLEALIRYYEATGDARIPPLVQRAVDFLWEESGTWVPAVKAFKYISVDVPGDDPPDPAPDVNLLVAPAFAWLYHRTGDSKYQIAGDQIFEGAVDGAWLYGGKQFTQNYRWSFEYVRLRSMAPLQLTSP